MEGWGRVGWGKGGRQRGGCNMTTLIYAIMGVGWGGGCKVSGQLPYLYK